MYENLLFLHFCMEEGRGADVWQLGAQPGGQAGEAGFHIPSQSSLTQAPSCGGKSLLLFNFTPGVRGQALAGLISSASCPGVNLLNSASLQSPEQSCSRDKTWGQRAWGQTSAVQVGQPG